MAQSVEVRPLLVLQQRQRAYSSTYLDMPSRQSVGWLRQGETREAGDEEPTANGEHGENKEYEHRTWPPCSTTEATR